MGGRIVGGYIGQGAGRRVDTKIYWSVERESVCCLPEARRAEDFHARF